MWHGSEADNVVPNDYIGLENDPWPGDTTLSLHPQIPKKGLRHVRIVSKDCDFPFVRRVNCRGNMARAFLNHPLESSPEAIGG
jgi:hypothetical protein